MKTTFYQVLGISQSIGIKELELAYRILIANNDHMDAKTYLQIEEAYEVLRNPSLRHLYDLSLRSKIYDWDTLVDTENIFGGEETSEMELYHAILPI